MDFRGDLKVVGKISFRGDTLHFDRICPITRDLLYEGYKSDDSRIMVVVTNPVAHDHQERYLTVNGSS